MEQQRSAGDPKDHTAHVKRMLADLVAHLRSDVPKIDEPQAKAMFEVTAEVVGGLIKAFDDFELRSEPAWRLS